MRIDIKPLSVNAAWQGRRFKTPAYEKYERDVLLLLPKMEVPDGLMCIKLIFGFSSLGSDFDNAIKPFIDCMQKKYGFNDNRIKRAIIEVENVAKGAEFIEFELSNYKPSIKEKLFSWRDAFMALVNRTESKELNITSRELEKARKTDNSMLIDSKKGKYKIMAGQLHENIPIGD
jgi:Holliday junction resolvase RusA-like endonuclease